MKNSMAKMHYGTITLNNNYKAIISIEWVDEERTENMKKQTMPIFSISGLCLDEATFIPNFNVYLFFSFISYYLSSLIDKEECL